jgi:hypothetical protein
VLGTGRRTQSRFSPLIRPALPLAD